MDGPNKLYYTKLERLGKDKHISLFCPILS